MSFRKMLTLITLLIIILVLTSYISSSALSTTLSVETELSYAQELQDALDNALKVGSGSHQLGVSAAIIIPGHKIWLGVAGVSHPGTPITSEMLFGYSLMGSGVLLAVIDIVKKIKNTKKI